VVVSANATDNVAVASVQFQLDGASLGALDTASPYSISWDSTKATNGSHTLRALAKDTSNNSTTSTAVTVTVSNAADTTPPSVPTGLTATATSSTQINLSWTTSTDNVGVTGYKIFRAGAQIGTSPSTAYQDLGLTASTSYTYTVAAFDAAGNTSAQSAGASATTQASSGGGGIPGGLGWYQIPNTTMSSIAPTYSDIQAVQGATCVVDCWGSGLADTKRQRLIVWGGGHNGYYGNEVYSLNLTANPITMTLLHDASHGTALSNLSTCPDAWADGLPAPRHTGGGLEYLPTQDVYHTHGWGLPPCGGFGDGMWWFNPNTNSWLPEKNPAEPNGPHPDSDGSVGNEAYDSMSDAIYRFEVNGTAFYSYSPASNAWTQLQAYGSGCAGTRSMGVVDPVRRFYICSRNSGGFWKVSLSSPYTETQLSPSGCGGLTTDGGAGMAYDSTQGLIVFWQGGDTVYEYNPDTNSCSSVTYAGGPGATAANGTYGRFRYFPALGVFAVVNRFKQNAYALRLTASGTGGTSGPVISAVTVNSISTTGATVSWTTDVSATTQVEYGTTTAYGALTTLNSTLVTSHNQALTGLPAGTLYHFRVHSKNGSGVESISGDAAFSTNSTTDTTPPTVSITAPASGATVSGTIAVTANATDNVGVTGVQFLLDGANLGTQTSATPPYSVSWDTTGASNGSHTLGAKAFDAAGNVGNAIGVTVTISNSGTTPLADFQARCGQPGVIVCQGFDDAAGIPHSNGTDSGALPANNGTSYPTQDTSVVASGSGSLRFDIPTPSGSSNPDGYWRQLMQSNLSAGPGTAQLFAQNSTFYVQYRQRMTSAYITNTWGGGTWFKQSIFSPDNSTCGQQELTVINALSGGHPEMYSQCGADPFQDTVGSLIYLEQGDTKYTVGYNCTYPYPGSGNCFHYQPDVWMTFTYKVSIGTWGTPGSTVQAWATVNGQGYAGHMFINQTNLTLNLDGGSVTPGYNTVWLLPYFTGGYSGASGPATTWYDELIVSTQSITAPNN
jgi:chitodextrinase